MAKLYYTIGEVAGQLGESVSLVRYWSEYFSKHIHPKRNAKGNRLYSADDIDVLKQVRYLVRDSGLTLDGAAKRLQTDGATVENKTKVLESLRAMREQLQEIRNSL